MLAKYLPVAGHTGLEPFGHGDLTLAFKLGIQGVPGEIVCPLAAEK